MNNVVTNFERVVLDRLDKALPPYVKLRGSYYYRRIRGPMERELIEIGNIAVKGQTAIDIGANWGVWSYRLSQLFTRVEAFEPIPACVKSIRACHIHGVNVHNVALSSFEGKSILNIPLLNGKPEQALATFNEITNQHESISVPVHTLDEYQFKNVGLIKIDVEGHELEILKGAKSTLLREKPSMVIEIEQRHLSFPLSKVFDFTFSLGYDAFFLNGGKMCPYTEFSYNIHQEQFLCRNITKSGSMPRGYINNFIFKHN